MSEFKSVFRLLLISFSSLLIIVFSDNSGILKRYYEIATELFVKIFNTEPDTTMTIIYMFLPFFSMSILLEVLWGKIIKIYRSHHHKIFNAFWYCVKNDILDIFYIHNSSKIWSLTKIINFRYERYDLKTKKRVFDGFMSFYGLIFHPDEENKRTHNKVLISACNCKDIKVFVEICLHVNDEEHNYVSIYHSSKNKSYNNEKIIKHPKSQELIKHINGIEYERTKKELLKKLSKTKKIEVQEND